MTASDLLDWGTHYFDLYGMYSTDRPAEWIIGQVNEPVENAYGGAYEHHTESQAFGMWEYDDGVVGIASTEEGADALESENIFYRIVGTDGLIEVGRNNGSVRYHQNGDRKWTAVDFDEEEDRGHTGAINDALRGVETGREPELNGRNVLNATEISFEIWESSRRRSRVEPATDKK
ncbi:Gfo/Idh/MocA family oxidoreductase [Halosimplex amylolyticum]|uniref:Gfo/Idh/MocA family oxidoreductase n=1 Tax=Halosimplex amylolyticum TaxID=3396616 RepID=UPI003F55F649